jgi:protein SCO1/2
MKQALLILGVVCSTLALLGCKRSGPIDAHARVFEVRGIVRGFTPDRRTVDVQHEDIPGFMPSMTMPFTVKEQEQVAALKIGDAIQFRVIVTEKDLFLDQVKQIAATDVRVKAPSPTASIAQPAGEPLKEGEIVPFFALTNQENVRITSDTFRGHPFVLTFVFTRCTVPSFCPRISHNFSDLQNAIKADPALAGTRLLSVTFDPSFDTPAILKAYAEDQEADPAVWNFATGEQAQIDNLTRRFAVVVQPQDGTIAHSLATVLIAPDGTVAKIWRTNTWQPSAVIEELRRRAK